MRPPARAPQALRKSRRRLPAWLSLRGRSPVRSGASPSCRTTSCTGPSSTAVVISLPWSSPTSSSVMCAHSSASSVECVSTLQPLACGAVGTCMARSRQFRAQFVGDLLRSGHPPCVGDKLGQPLDVHLGQPQHYQRPVAVSRRGEEQMSLAAEQSLFLRLVANIQNCDLGTNDTRLARQALRVGPNEPLATDAEVKAVAVDLLHTRQRQREAAHVVGVSHGSSSRIAASAYA